MMPNNTPVLSFEQIARQLEESTLTWAVFAGAAAAVYGARRPINDLDILIGKKDGQCAAALFPQAEIERNPDGSVWGIRLPDCDILAGAHIIELDQEMV
ncbi:hypothetical protein ACFLZW_02660, partial [Chloroflexota bacterium]